MRHRVGADLPALGDEAAQLLPGEAVELVAVGSVLPGVDHGAAQRLLVRVDEAGGHEHGGGYPQALQDREAVTQD